MQRTSTINARSYILDLPENCNPYGLKSTLVRWIWRYVFTSKDIECFSKLDEKGIAVSRNDIEQYNDFKLKLENQQFIYVMVEEGTDPPICKIGRTNIDPKVRERKLNASTSQHRRISLYCSWPVIDSVVSEVMIHEILDEYRINKNREFFEMAPRDAEFAIGQILNDFGQLA